MTDSGPKLWDQVLDLVREDIDADEFRRWFVETSQAGDSGDHVTVWVSSAATSRHISVHYQRLLDRALDELGRRNTVIRFLAAGYSDDDED